MTQFNRTRPHTLVMLLSLTVTLLSTMTAGAQDKSAYNLFNPTPTKLMRDLSADRPDGTESPYTVDAGRYQIELSFIDYTRNDDNGVKTDSFTVFDTNIKAGLTHNMDLQIVFGTYVQEETDGPGTTETRDEGFSDIQLRLKINLWGNDGGETAFGIMPFIKLPSSNDVSNDRVEGGIASMLAWNVAENWGLGFMTEFDAVYDENDNDYDFQFIHTLVLGFDVVGPVGAYVEYIGVLNTETDNDYQAIFSTGITYAINNNLLLDVGTQIGLTQAADDMNMFTGLTWRF